ncbi:hypothetical protein CPB85DRAFT_975853 [Mucidula mucida]|nr:hypothetical protein CPB85DRAFT_975853 [Mucidula mucida]
MMVNPRGVFSLFYHLGLKRTIWSLNTSAVEHCIVPKSVKALCSSVTSTGLLLDVGYRPPKIYNTGVGCGGPYKDHFTYPKHDFLLNPNVTMNGSFLIFISFCLMLTMVIKSAHIPSELVSNTEHDVPSEPAAAESGAGRCAWMCCLWYA